MTADEFLDSYLYKPGIPWSLEIEENYGAINTAMIEFAKMHVKAALEIASEQARTIVDPELEDYSGIKESELMVTDKESILEAYPLENIK